jgi:hypothetical protein
VKKTHSENTVLIGSMWKSQGYYKQFAEIIQTKEQVFLPVHLWIIIDMKGTEFVSLSLSIYIQILNTARDKSV